MTRIYTGIGSRRTPREILTKMTGIANLLSKYGYTLRSGGAEGADSAFEEGADNNNKQIFYAKDATIEAMGISSKYHPAWQKCSDYAKKLHGRNAFQVLGPDLDDPVDFVLCWTPDGCESHASRTIDTGGTGTAISIASERGIPVFNLNNPASLPKLKLVLNLIKKEASHAN